MLLRGGGVVPWSDRDYIGIGQSVFRMFQTGLPDNSFAISSPFYYPVDGGQFVVLPDDKVLVTGGRDLYSTVDTSLIGGNFCLTRYDTLGNLDTTFQHRQCQNGVALRIVASPDGKFLLSGVQGMFDGQPVGRIFRVLPDGALDTTFHTNIDFGSATDYYFYNDGRILASGWFHTPDIPNDTLGLVRLMPDGSIDPTFNYDLRFRLFSNSLSLGVVQGMYTLDSATILLGGSFATLNEEWVGGVCAIDTSGNVLPEYFPGTNCDTIIGPNPGIIALGMRDFEMGPDGMLYAYGFFHGFDDGYQNHPDQTMIIRLKQVNVGVEEQRLTSGRLVLQPNPGSDLLVLQFANLAPNGTLEVLDMDGRLVHTAPVRSPVLQLDVSVWAPGLYAVRYAGKDGTSLTERWVKQ